MVFMYVNIQSSHGSYGKHDPKCLKPPASESFGPKKNISPHHNQNNQTLPPPARSKRRASRKRPVASDLDFLYLPYLEVQDTY